MQFLNIIIFLVFGFGAVGLVNQFFSPHWFWLVAAYCAGSVLGLGAIYLAYAFPTRARRPPPVETRETSAETVNNSS
ncbi:hypothetical protein [Vannielia litorea]|uniref:hypothetical protein n=1 Tax=Vannielia litorea TaxID=1217970 RepID=UPI001BD0D959|nr:hypothetical protein [Vannielia litorea]MBS8226430.1 hypothetical protein [Vannielia litorea]